MDGDANPNEGAGVTEGGFVGSRYDGVVASNARGRVAEGRMFGAFTGTTSGDAAAARGAGARRVAAVRAAPERAAIVFVAGFLTAGFLAAVFFAGAFFAAAIFAATFFFAGLREEAAADFAAFLRAETPLRAVTFFPAGDFARALRLFVDFALPAAFFLVAISHLRS